MLLVLARIMIDFPFLYGTKLKIFYTIMNFIIINWVYAQWLYIFALCLLVSLMAAKNVYSRNNNICFGVGMMIFVRIVCMGWLFMCIVSIESVITFYVDCYF